LDTSIYRKDPKREKGGFRALKRLCRGQKIKLYIPEVVKREFVSQQRIAVEDDIRRIFTAAKSITRITKSEKLKHYAQRTIKEADVMAPRVGARVRMEFKEWADECHAEALSIRPKHGNRVMDDYFDGNPPFSSPKHRDDIPDSFIFQSIVDLASGHETVYVIANDGGLFNAVEKIKNIKTFKELDEFTSIKECQEALATLTGEIIAENIERARRIIPQQSVSLAMMLDSEIIDALTYRTVHDRHFSEDSSEATISMVGDTEPEFDFDNIEYYGGSEIGIPFKATSECTLEYPISKSEYVTMDEIESAKISVTDLNDHFFEAEREFPIGIKGTLSVEITTDHLENPDVSEEDLIASIENGQYKVEIEETWIVEEDSGR
jgi:rRNA-processing protein FCF1